MSISSLSKVNVYFHRENKKTLIQRLQDLACIHIVDFKESVIAAEHDDLVTEDEFTDFELEKRINDLAFVIRCLSPFEKKSGLLSMIVGKGVLVSKEEYAGILSSFDETQIVKEVRDLETEEHTLLSEITNNEAMMRELEPWKELNIALKDIKDSETTSIRLGKLPANKLGQLRESLDRITSFYELHEVNIIGDAAYVMISYMKDFADAIDDALTIESFERKDFQKQAGKMSDIINSYIKKDKKDDERLAEIGVELSKYAVELPKLKIVYDNLFNEYEKKRVERNFGSTDNVSLIEGFVDVEDLPALKETIEGEFKCSEVIEVEVRDGETVPTKLKNKKITKSFEIVVDLYGMPASNSFDPTVFLMPFFAIFFGFCLTDGGYGILLAIFSLFLVKKYKPIFGSSKLIWVLFICGLTTIAVGAITGGWFGDLINYLPDSMSGIKNFKDSMVLFDPMQQSMVFFTLSLVLGFTHLLFGLIMSFIKYVKDGKLIDGLCKKMTWIVFLLSILFWMLAMKGVLPAELAIPSKYMFFTSCAAIVIFSERDATSIGVRIASGLYNLYGSISYVGDTLSYLRLLALGLASGVIAVVTNVICKLAFGIPYVGFIIAVVIFIGGHTFNLVMSSLGAFVHTLRLNYAEFFPKFFEGGGKIFIPFKMTPNYTIFKDEEDVSR